MRFYEIAWEATKAITTFTIKHVRIIFKLATAVAILIYVLSLRHDIARETTEKISAQLALSKRIDADAAADKKRTADNKLNELIAQKKTDALILTHKNQLAAVLLKGKSNEAKTNADTATSTRTLNNYRDGLRLAIEREAAREAARMLGDDRSGLAGANSYTAIPRPVHETEEELAVCKEAGAVAAADYNYCLGYVKSQQIKLGVQK